MAIARNELAARRSPIRWRCGVCGVVCDTRKPESVCPHLPPWVEADRQQEADLARFRSAEQNRMAGLHAMRAAGGRNRYPDELRDAIKAADGSFRDIADQFGVSLSTVKSIRGGRPRLPDAIYQQVLRDPRSSGAVAKELGISKSAVWSIRQQAKESAPGG